MAPVPTAEQPPQGLDAYWLGCWRHALKVMKEQGTWAWEQKPLLDEYVKALMLAAEEDVRPADLDRHVTRALRLANALILTPEAQKRHGIYDDAGEVEQDPFDELAARRASVGA